ncbi:hypothetical protein [Sorangium sp. So ce854]|uniref:hypothetical protein n=1 Tax=Sorangium sp. So ce854 TaxID=3133322 RepID=UPI003F5F7CC3
MRGGRDRRGRGTLRSIALIALGCASAAGGAGCYAEDCATTFSCHPLPGETPPVLPASPCDGDPATSPAKDGCGVFVARHGDDAGAGTRKAPVRTLQRAVEKAAEPGGTRRVYACAEDFEEAVTLPSGVALWGGRDCAAEAWTWGGAESFTGIAPEPGRVPLTVEARQESLTSAVFGVRLVAADAIRPSGSSIGMIVGEGAAVEVVSSEILAGNGADGADGESAPQGTPWRAPDGAGGQKGGDGCLADWTAGAPPAVTVCEDGTRSIGGAGGDGDLAAGGDGEPGAPATGVAPEPGSLEDGEGGKGGAMTCAPGEKGGAGEPGANGVGGGQGPEQRLNYGSISAHGWAGLSGQDGQSGGIGQGGGGGGGVGPNGKCRAMDPQGGPSGGSGGGGGCGGRRGRGGGYGGGSFGILALHAHVMVDKTEIITGDGGRGGNGGRGQEGGWGGPAGPRGAIAPAAYFACDGGWGGAGGKGGHGGGGLGGVSVTVAVVDSSVHLTESADWSWGAPGAGGRGGDPNVKEARGEDGRTAVLWEFPELIVPPR